MASELMIANHGIQACMRDRKFEQIIGLMQIGAGEGMHTIDDSLAHLLRGGYISLDEALINCRDRETMAENFPQPAAVG